MFSFVLPEITRNLPIVLLNESYKPGTMDLLIGCDLFYELLCIGLIKEKIILLQKIVYVRVVSGPIDASHCSFISSSYFAKKKIKPKLTLFQ